MRIYNKKESKKLTKAQASCIKETAKELLKLCDSGIDSIDLLNIMTDIQYIYYQTQDGKQTRRIEEGEENEE